MLEKIFLPPPEAYTPVGEFHRVRLLPASEKAELNSNKIWKETAYGSS